MAADKGEREGRKQRRSESAENHADMNYEEEPDFSDPEDFVDDVTDEGSIVFHCKFPSNMCPCFAGIFPACHP